MVKFISHRGNLNGPGSALGGENSQISIGIAIDKGYDVEIDVWSKDNKIYTGHDGPGHELKLGLINQRILDKIWFHAKTIETCIHLRSMGPNNIFLHWNDDATITNHGYIWVHPKKIMELFDDKISYYGDSVAVMPELVTDNFQNLDRLIEFYGVCTDYPETIKKILYHD